MLHHEYHVKNSLAERVQSHTGVKVERCYQCGKCSAGCPVSDMMDYPPSQLLRLLQTETAENDEKVIRSYAVWLCLNCEMCIGRCPMEVDIPPVMDYLRTESVNRKMVNSKAKDIIAFHEAFLNSIRYTGRLYELGLVAGYKLKTFDLLQDIQLAPQMIVKGKLPFIPEKINKMGDMKRIFSKTINKGGKL